MKVSVFVPSHITGFFSIYHNKNPLKKGSCGAGILIDKGVTTTLKTLKIDDKTDFKSNFINDKPITNDSIDITINGKKDTANEIITLKTIEILQRNFKSELPKIFNHKIAIEHDINIPVRAGFGTSASCALGTAIGISKLFNLPISKTEAGQIAHFAELELKSGLGDVLSQTSKGIVIRESPGAPGIGKTKNISYYHNIEDSIKEEKIIKNEKNDFSDIYVVSKTFGEIDTSSIIQDPHKIKKINEIGLSMQKKIVANPSVQNFIDCSYEFAKKTELMTDEISAIVEDLKKYTIGSSMAMLGNTVFSLSKKENLHNIKDIDNFTISKIYNDGIKINAKI